MQLFILGAGNLQCSSVPLALPASAVTFGLIGVFIFFFLLCIIIQCCKGENRGPCRSIIYCFNCFAIFALFGLIIAGFVLGIFVERKSQESDQYDCTYLPIYVSPLAASSLSSIFVILAGCCWFLCCDDVLRRNRYNTEKLRDIVEVVS